MFKMCYWSECFKRIAKVTGLSPIEVSLVEALPKVSLLGLTCLHLCVGRVVVVPDIYQAVGMYWAVFIDFGKIPPLWQKLNLWLCLRVF